VKRSRTRRIKFTPAEIEASRREAIDNLGSEDEQGKYDPGIVPEDNIPGTFSYHEALHTASVLMDSVDRHLVEHPAILLDKEAFGLAHAAHSALFNLYQHLGSKHL
jgi:hypothetical protein